MHLNTPSPPIQAGKSMLVLTSPRFEEHTPPPGHPERPERAQVFDTIASSWRDLGVPTTRPRPATRDELQRAHTAAHVNAMELLAGRAAAIDADTFTSPESHEIALLAAGAAVQAGAHAAETGEIAVALVRPPGHHAERDRAMGFCLFNNVAVAAAAVLARGLARVAIIDIDVHHGNGTQDIFYEDPRVLYVSTHQSPFYPGTGAADEVGRHAGEGFTVNVPMEAGSTDADYRHVYSSIANVIEQYSPQLVFISAGYDAHADDPLASMRMSTNGYGEIVRLLRKTAARCASPIVLVTEGGYDLDALRDCLDVTLRVLSEPGNSAASGAALGNVVASAAPRGVRAMASVRAAQSRFWPGL
ncbi:MAG: histone deacetylase [Vicinamibacterales bacterium]